MPVQWESRFETGDTQLDDQHKRLFDFVNKLEAMTASPAPLKPDDLDHVVSFLSVWVRIHFVCEESCMTARRCAVAEKNKAAHTKFLEYFEEFKRNYERRGADKAMLRDLHNAANQWLVNHICKIDVQLREARAAAAGAGADHALFR